MICPALQCCCVVVQVCISALFSFQTVKGGISETRIEKRIVITGDTEIDHDKVRNLLTALTVISWQCACFLLGGTWL